MITYPVNANSRFTFKLAGQTTRGVPWPRADGQALRDPAPGLVILEESVAELPSYNPATQKLDAGQWVDNETNQTAIFTRSTVTLSQAELDALAAREALNAKRTLIKNAIPTLRNWSNQAGGITVTTGNAVTVLQGVIDNLETFYSRFADLLETEHYDK
jgi:hypothetical protein